MWILDRGVTQPSTMESCTKRQHLASTLRKTRPSTCCPRHTKCRYADFNLPWTDASCFIPHHMDLVLQVSLVSRSKDTLLEWLKFMICTLPFGLIPYFILRSWWESLRSCRPQQSHACQPPIMMHGVDVSRSVLLMRPSVLKAVEFAAEAHTGQIRKNGQPYVSHCLETALIFEDLLAPSIENDRAEPAFMAALLHDVLDDTQVPANRILKEFGPGVCGLVQKVSELSLMIQLLRRRRRMSNSKALPDCGWNEEESSKLKSAILKKMQEPLVLLIKLSDRLHNMRTVFALQPDKRHAVAAETRDLFCTLAERLGLFALKAELDDLCFAVLEPKEFSRTHYDMQVLWHPDRETQDTPPSERILVPEPEMLGVSSVPVPSHICDECSIGDNFIETKHAEAENGLQGPYVWGKRPGKLNEQKIHLGCSCALSNDVMTNEQCQELLSWVPSFQNVMFYWSSYCEDMSFGQTFLREQTERLLHEIAIESFGAGFQIDVSGRVKSMYSAHRKMKKKNLAHVSDVLDVLGLRVVVNDDGDQHQARELCYIILSAVQRLWKSVPQELDDYIANPKTSGYQSLHTSVVGPGNIPFEIQIRTSSMDEQAEYGSAAHWCYKESVEADDNTTEQNHLQPFYVGQPVWRIQSGCYFDGVIVQCEDDGRHVLVAVHLQGQFPRRQGARAASRQDYEDLLHLVKEKGWFKAGHGNLFTALERYVLCVDGAHHRVDHYGQKEGKTVVRPINNRDFFSEQDDFGGSDTVDAGSVDHSHKVDVAQVQRMRLGLKYYKELSTTLDREPPQDNDVCILLWPDAKIACFPRGTTAADVLAERGWIEIGETKSYHFPPVVNVNNQLVPEETVLQDGDFLVMAREKLQI